MYAAELHPFKKSSGAFKRKNMQISAEIKRYENLKGISLGGKMCVTPNLT